MEQRKEKKSESRHDLNSWFLELTYLFIIFLYICDRYPSPFWRLIFMALWFLLFCFLFFCLFLWFRVLFLRRPSLLHKINATTAGKTFFTVFPSKSLRTNPRTQRIYQANNVVNARKFSPTHHPHDNKTFLYVPNHYNRPTEYRTCPGTR